MVCGGEEITAFCFQNVKSFHIFLLEIPFYDNIKEKGAIVMNNLDLQLKQINQNLNTIISNQLLIYQKLELLQEKMEERNNI